MKIKLGVIFGGESVEHEVSIITAIQAMNKIDEEKYEIIPIYINKKGEWFTGESLREVEIYQDTALLERYNKNVVLYNKDSQFILQAKKGLFKSTIKEIDIAFPIVHGTNVEDGTLQGYLQTVGIPYVGSDVYASVVSQDKVYMKQIFKSEELPVANYTWFYDTEYKKEQERIVKQVEKLGYPVIVKPATLGSSVGISVAKNQKALIEAIDDAITYDSKIVVEEVIENLKEVNISVLGNYDIQNLSVIEEVLSTKEFLTYEEKYIGGDKVKGKLGVKASNAKWSKGMASATRQIPANISMKLQEEIEDISIKAFKSLKNSGVVRIDYLIDDKKNKVYINEVNSIPGSLSFYLWEPAGKKYTELLDELINIGIKDYKKRISKVHSFNTNILQGYQNNSLKGGKGLKGGKIK